MLIFDEALEASLFQELQSRIASRSDLTPYNQHSHWYSLDQRPRLLPEFAIRSLLPLLPDGADVAGVEWWVQDVPPTQGMIWHFDHDREVLRLEGRLVHPVWATVFYFDIGASPTVVMEQTLEDRRAVPPRWPSAGFACPPQENRLSIFKGNLLHGVAAGPTSSGTRRVTMPRNWCS